jgi:hypothetical protein
VQDSTSIPYGTLGIEPIEDLRILSHLEQDLSRCRGLRWIWTRRTYFTGSTVGWKEHCSVKRLHTHGLEAIGTLNSKRIAGNDDDKSYFVAFEFEDNAGRKHKTLDWQVEQRLWESLSEAQELSVLYDPENPERNLLYVGRIYLIQSAQRSEDASR